MGHLTTTPDLATLADEVSAVAARQGRDREVSPESERLIQALAERFGFDGSPPEPADPHDELLFYRALSDAQAGIGEGDRRRVRVGLQRLEDALRQIVTGDPVREGREPADLARWLLEQVPHGKLAELLGVDRRTLNRWTRTESPTRPGDEDLRRLRDLARTFNLLRRGLTPAGALLWFETPSPALGGERPADALDRFDSRPRLERAAYETLGGDAT